MANGIESQTLNHIIEEDKGQEHIDNAVQTLSPRLLLKLQLWVLRVWKLIADQSRPIWDRKKK